MISRSLPLLSIVLAASFSTSRAESPPHPEPPSPALEDTFFAGEVWANVGAANCLKCHKAGGDAEESKLVLRDPRRSEGASQSEDMRHNREAFARMARVMEGGQSRLLQKATGQLDHEGKEVLKPDSAGYRILAEFVARVNAPPGALAAREIAEEKNAPPFFDGIAMLDDRRLLRRVTLSLAGRLPTDAELSAIAARGGKVLPELLDALMKEDAFYERLREGFNDVFLTLGFDGNPETALSYEHFSTTRGWAEKFDLSPIADEKARQKARYKLYADYRAALLGEPMKLIEHIVRNDHPFTETIASRFAKTGFNFKSVLKDWIASDFYRADGLTTAAADPARRAELDDVGLVRMLAPEQIERKVAAIFGKPWGKLNEQMAILYGGIDSKEVTARAADPSGAMGAIQRILANDVACKWTALDFTRPSAERLLFPGIEPDVLPGTSPENDAKIRGTIVHLNERILGRYDAPNSTEVERAFQLFAGILSDAAQRKDIDARETYSCRREIPGEAFTDPNYTVRAWRAVITYLLRQHEFLYE